MVHFIVAPLQPARDLLVAANRACEVPAGTRTTASLATVTSCATAASSRPLPAERAGKGRVCARAARAWRLTFQWTRCLPAAGVPGLPPALPPATPYPPQPTRPAACRLHPAARAPRQSRDAKSGAKRWANSKLSKQQSQEKLTFQVVDVVISVPGSIVSDVHDLRRVCTAETLVQHLTPRQPGRAQARCVDPGRTHVWYHRNLLRKARALPRQTSYPAADNEFRQQLLLLQTKARLWS
jgi:hypothetical protein